ncbi:MAG: glucosyl-3-phosphoglycerate synthase [Chloroflexota bacterium]
MKTAKVFKPFPRVLIPVFNGGLDNRLLQFCRQLQGSRLILLGLVQVDAGKSLSAGTIKARQLRKNLADAEREYGLEAEIDISVAYDRWDGLNSFLTSRRVDLVVFNWLSLGELGDGSFQYSSVKRINANVAIIRGIASKESLTVTVPLRGGPHAQLALRLGLALPHERLNALHLYHLDSETETVEPPLRGISKILPNLPEVHYVRKSAPSPVEEILQQAKQSDVVILGITEPLQEGATGLGGVADRLITESDCMVVVVKSQQPAPRQSDEWKTEMIGAKAISILVDKWFAENTFHASEFDDIENLVRLKENQNLTISLALPALNEEKTVGKVIGVIQKSLVEKYPLLDEIVLMDSDSTDRTREIAQSLGVPVYIHQQILPQYGARAGKGEALWKSLYVTRGDLVVWIDSDIVNIHPRFVYGVLGPMLVNRHIQFVKGFYQRPLRTGRRVQSSGGGRVTELTARPLLNLFYPELSGVIQPLSGEYGGRRKTLEKLIFFTGYGVETGLLIDALEKFGLSAIAQVDLLERIHHNQTLTALSKMSFAIIQTVLKKLEERLHTSLFEDINRTMKLVQYEAGNYYLDVKEIVELDRPAMITLPEYREIFYPDELLEESKVETNASSTR